MKAGMGVDGWREMRNSDDAGILAMCFLFGDDNYQMLPVFDENAMVRLSSDVDIKW